jgi:Flp pilus assembly secretin CpaC
MESSALCWQIIPEAAGTVPEAGSIVPEIDWNHEEKSLLILVTIYLKLAEWILKLNDP